MRVQVIDYETYWDKSAYTLNKIGPVEYIRDARFHAQMLGVSTNGAPAQVFTDVRAGCARIDFANDLLVAHNGSGFDFLIFSERYGVRPQNMVDTICCARWCGLSRIIPESHAALTELLGNGVKRAGTVISDGKNWPDDFTPEEQVDFMKYCAEDVDQCAANFAAMLPYLTPECVQFQSITARMATEPVFEIDAEILEEYIRQLDAEAEEARQKIMTLFHFGSLQEFFKAIRSADRFAEMLRSLEVEPPVKVSEAKTATARASDPDAPAVYTWAFSKSDIEFLDLLEHENPGVRLLVQTRLQFNGSILRTRAETLLKFARMGKPLPVMLSAFKAHTSRYSAGVSEGKSDAVQVQNLSKRNPAQLALRRAIHAPAGQKIVACDSSQVEARCLAWIANQTDLLDRFRQGRDPYAELAVNFDRQYTAQDIHDGAKSGDKHCKQLRNVAKTLILACGYGTSAKKFAATLLKDKMLLDSDRGRHYEIAERYHSIYRDNNAAIVYLWRRAQRIIGAMAAGYSGKFGGPYDAAFEYGLMRLGPLDMYVPSIKLPSGFILRYPDLHQMVNSRGEKEYVYSVQLGKNKVYRRLYGAKIVENLTQAFAFQILMFQACWMDSDGIDLKVNIHDAWATVVPEDKAQATGDRMRYWMRQAPAWAEGCPLDAEYEIGDTFEVV